MSVHLFDCRIAGTPSEPVLLQEVTVRLIEDCERGRFDEELVTKHYLKNANAVGRVLRYVAEYSGQWVALLTFNSAAYHLKLREQWLHWSRRGASSGGICSRKTAASWFGRPASGPICFSGSEIGVRATASGLAATLWLPGAGRRNLCRPATFPGTATKPLGGRS
jgi:hypothetical protein